MVFTYQNMVLCLPLFCLSLHCLHSVFNYCVENKPVKQCEKIWWPWRNWGLIISPKKLKNHLCKGVLLLQSELGFVFSSSSFPLRLSVTLLSTTVLIQAPFSLQSDPTLFHTHFPLFFFFFFFPVLFHIHCFQIQLTALFAVHWELTRATSEPNSPGSDNI